jgi:hypothetical protein
MWQAPGDNDYANLMLLGGVEGERPGAERNMGDADGLALLSGSGRYNR